MTSSPDPTPILTTPLIAENNDNGDEEKSRTMDTYKNSCCRTRTKQCSSSRRGGPPEDKKKEPKRAVVVFSSLAKYDTAFYILVSLGPLTILGVFIWTLLGGHTDKSPRTLGACLLFLVVVFSLVLPRQFLIYSDASLGIQTMIRGVTWRFDHVTAADENPSFWGLFRLKFKFATSLRSNRVLVLRKRGWDVLVSPQDPKEFVDAISRVSVAVMEEEHADSVPAAS